MLPDRVSNPGLLTYESGALPIALRCPSTPSYLELCTTSISNHFNQLSRKIRLPGSFMDE